MKSKTVIKMAIDLVMTVLLLLQMAYMLVGEKAHEWIGLGMFALFVIHHILNLKWYRNLNKGKYTGFRIFQTIVNFMVLLSMVGLMVSGIMMSREVFAFLSIEGGMGFARMLHMLSAYWGLVLMSIHIGLHWNMVMGMMRKISGPHKQEARRGRTITLRLITLAISASGINAFLKHRIADYMFMQSQFVFFDMNQPLIGFFGEYLTIMGLWICIAYYLSKGLKA